LKTKAKLEKNIDNDGLKLEFKAMLKRRMLFFIECTNLLYFIRYLKRFNNETGWQEKS
jgi:hypothetical protein